MPSVVRVLIVDDHAVVRAGLRLRLDREEDVETVGEAGNAREAVGLAERLSPDVVLMDVVMPGVSGIDAAAEIRHIRPGTRILMLSMQDDPSYVRQAITNGAMGYDLGRRNHGTHRSHPQSGRQASSTCNRRWAPRSSSQTHPRGTPTRSPFGSGKSSPYSRSDTRIEEIADRLFVSVRTVEAHRAHILTKLGLSSRAELVRYAIHAGLLDSE